MSIQFKELFSDPEGKNPSMLLYDEKDLWSAVYMTPNKSYRWDVISRKDNSISMNGVAKSLEDGKHKATSVLKFIEQFKKEFSDA